MIDKLAQALVGAEGRSEFVIVAVADIRGFSDFSTRNESPNIAMFIKRFYLKLLENYFPSANFVKPTGDGLLMTFRYSEHNLMEVASTVVDAALRCVAEFPALCVDDPMINFTVPDSIGFGIARGTACCLYSGDETLDYSGHLLNLASRLNDLARPSGVVIDGSFLARVIPEQHRGSFGEQKVFVRSIAEDAPIDILYQKERVRVPDASLTPLRQDVWLAKTLTFTVRQIAKLGNFYLAELERPPKRNDLVRVAVSFPKRNVKGVAVRPDFTDFQVRQDGPRTQVAIDMDAIKQILATSNASQNAQVTIIVNYVPRPLPRT